MQTLSDADELAVLQAQLLQWSYLNARADHAAQSQEETVCATLHGAFLKVADLKARLCDDQLKLVSLDHAKRLNDAVTEMEQGLIPIAAATPPLRLHYTRIARAVVATTHALLVTGVSTAESPELLRSALAACQNQLRGLNTMVDLGLPKIENLAGGIADLGAAVEGEIEAVNSCIQRLGLIASKETFERSLRIQQKQLLKLAGVDR